MLMQKVYFRDTMQTNICTLAVAGYSMCEPVVTVSLLALNAYNAAKLLDSEQKHTEVAMDNSP